MAMCVLASVRHFAAKSTDCERRADQRDASQTSVGRTLPKIHTIPRHLIRHCEGIEFEFLIVTLRIFRYSSPNDVCNTDMYSADFAQCWILLHVVLDSFAASEHFEWSDKRDWIHKGVGRRRTYSSGVLEEGEGGDLAFEPNAGAV
eukprot:scaffold14259_cov104-Cylindrotheca_fusiformis.AAC.3